MHSSEVEEYFAPKSSSIECGAKSGGLMGINVLKGQKIACKMETIQKAYSVQTREAGKSPYPAVP